MKPLSRSTSVFLFVLFQFAILAFADDFKPISQAELAMKDNPASPGDHAMVLEWTRVEVDTQGYEDNYFRIKIFNEEGKKYGDIEIPFFKDYYEVNGIKARTIHSDGTVIPFNGKVYEKTIVKGKGVKYLAKTFSLADVQPGSVLEYRYRTGWEPSRLFDRKWILQNDLFIKKAYFKIEPHERAEYPTLWQAFRLPPGKAFKKNARNFVELELDDIPAFDEERFSPPERELKMRFDFFYREFGENAKNAQEFWIEVNKKSYKDAEEFIGRRGKIAAAAADLVSPSDSGETKLRKLYAKVQSLRNQSYERERTEQEVKRDKSKDNKSVEDVLARGYGYRSDLIQLFVALARAAGFEAYVARISERDETFFNISTINEKQLDGHLAYVKADGKEYWLDPSTPFCPFGSLPWRKTGTAALILNSKDKPNFVATPVPLSQDAVSRRIANLKYADGMFKGEIAIVFSGQEALYRRINAQREDEQSVKKDLEDELKGMLAGGSTINLKKVEGLDGTSQTLSFVFDAEVPNPPSSAGSRYLMPTSIFEHGQSPFRHEKRKSPVYFNFPYQVLDSVTLILPEDYKVDAVPEGKHEETDFAYFDIKWAGAGNKISMKRAFAVQGILFPTNVYPEIRNFYAKVASGDEESVVLSAGQSSANK